MGLRLRRMAKLGLTPAPSLPTCRVLCNYIPVPTPCVQKEKYLLPTCWGMETETSPCKLSAIIFFSKPWGREIKPTGNGNYTILTLWYLHKLPTDSSSHSSSSSHPLGPFRSSSQERSQILSQGHSSLREMLPVSSL